MITRISALTGEVTQHEDAPVVEPTDDELLAAITAKYEAKRADLRNDVLHALTMDGGNMDGLVVSARAKWVQLADAEAAEIDATFS